MIEHEMCRHRCNLNNHRHEWLINCTKENSDADDVNLDVHARHQIPQIYLTIMTGIYILPKQVIENVF
jgi:hypothetical protein